MIIRLISLVVLVAFVNFTFGCTTAVKVPREELPKVKTDEKIIEVVLKTGDVIKFDSDGGKYYQSAQKIVGMGADGKPIEIPFQRVSAVRISKPETISKEQLVDQKIAEVVLSNGTLGIFDEQGGKYDKAKRVITGRATDGSSTKIDLNKVREIRTSHPETISKQDFLSKKDQFVAELVIQNRSVVTFDEKGGRLTGAEDYISGYTKDLKPVNVNVDDVLYVRVKRLDPVLSTLAVIGVLALAAVAAVAIIAATKESCPFVYSYDGQKYVFDAEPLGGAVCPGLKKTDYSRLEYLRPIDGKYLLMLRNEVEETQYMDEISLLVVDHPSNSEVVPDMMGQMNLIEKPLAPTSAKDENGMDLMKFIKERDGIAWQTALPTDDSFRKHNLRHQLTFEFSRPAQAKKTKLLVNAGTALWGSNMIREMLQLRGDKVDAWYEGVNKGGPELDELMQFMEREELYVLKIYVKQGEKWVQRGFIPGGGPLINEDRVIYLDLSDVPGDKLLIQLNPPLGFWSIDYLGMEYGDYSPPAVTEVQLASAEDQHGKDISKILSSTDNNYLMLPAVGDWAKVTFEQPPQKKGTKRSIFLKTTGYYEIHISKDKPEQAQLIRDLLERPGMIVEYSMDEYLKWRSQQLSSR